MGDFRIDVLHLGPAHSPGDISVWLPEQSLVIAGDMAFTRFGETRQLLTRGGAGSSEAAYTFSHVPGGHPEGYLEGFATSYAELCRGRGFHPVRGHPLERRTAQYRGSPDGHALHCSMPCIIERRYAGRAFRFRLGASRGVRAQRHLLSTARSSAEVAAAVKGSDHPGQPSLCWGPGRRSGSATPISMVRRSSSRN